MAFGVKTTNMFELLGDEDHDAVPQSVVSKSAAETKKTAPATTGAANVEARLKGSTGAANNVAPGRGRGGRGGRGGRANFDRQYRDEDDRGEGERSGPRPGRGRGGGQRHFERDSRRRGYDRHDNTGRGHETEKRGGGGGHNWGAVGEETPAAVEEVAGNEWKDEPANEPEAEVPVSANDATAEAPAEEAEPAEPEVEELTLDEYLKKMEEKRGSLKKKPAAETVKVDTKAFEGMKVYNPKEKEEVNELELSEKKVYGKSKTGAVEKNRKEKELLPTGFRVGGNEFGRGGRGRGDRGGRGDRPDRERPPRRTSDENSGGRGYGRGFSRSDRPHSGGRGREGYVPSLEDNRSFPTLGGT